MTRALIAFAFLFLATAAHAQSAVQVIGPVTPGNCVQWFSTTQVKDPGVTCNGGASTSPGGSNLQVQYNNAGTFGGYTNTQLTALINVATASLPGAIPAWPNNTTTYFRGDGTYAALPIGSATQFGIMECDNSTIVCPGGVLTAITGSGRKLLTTVTNFYVATTGSDVTGNGTSGNPWATRVHAYSVLQSQYDLGGQKVTINLSAGTYTDSLQVSTPLVGQAGPTGLIFTGPCTSGHTQDVIIAPAPNSGYAYSASGPGTGYRYQCQRVDQVNNLGTQIATITGVMSGATLTASGVTGQLVKGSIITGTGVAANTIITAYGSGQGGAGTYTINNSQSVSSETMGAIHSGADTVVAGQGAYIYAGNPTLFSLYSDLTYGCNVYPFNDSTDAFSGYMEWDNDFNIDVSGAGCTVAPTGTPTSGSATIGSISNLQNVVQYMGIIATDVPSDAYVNSISYSGSSITMACIYTTPCHASGSPGSETITFSGGGQTFLDEGNSANSYFNTNGDPSASIIIDSIGFPFFTAGFFNLQDLSAANAQGLTFPGRGNVVGKCFSETNISSLNTNNGIPYLPCHGDQAVGSASGVSLTAGSNTFTISSPSGSVSVGQVVDDEVITTGTWTINTGIITVGTGLSINAGAHIIAPGILGGAVVEAYNSGTGVISIGGCTNTNGNLNRCPGGYPAYINESSVSVIISGSFLSGSSVVTAYNSGSGAVTISDPVVASGTATLWFQGTVLRNSIYN